VISGRGCPLATHLSRTELPTGLAITRRLILEGCVKRGRAVGRGVIEVSEEALWDTRRTITSLSQAHRTPHAMLTPLLAGWVLLAPRGTAGPWDLLPWADVICREMEDHRESG
jgi:hypothetical protein